MVNKIIYQKIQYFKRKGFTKADIVRESGLNKRTVCKYYSMSEKEYSRYIEKVRYRTKVFEPYQSHILEVYKVNDFQKLEKNVEVVGVETDKQKDIGHIENEESMIWRLC